MAMNKTHSASQSVKSPEHGDEVGSEPQRSTVKEAWDYLGLNLGMLLLMAKWGVRFHGGQERRLIVLAQGSLTSCHCNCHVSSSRICIMTPADLTGTTDTKLPP